MPIKLLKTLAAKILGNKLGAGKTPSSTKRESGKQVSKQRKPELNSSRSERGTQGESPIVRRKKSNRNHGRSADHAHGKTVPARPPRKYDENRAGRSKEQLNGASRPHPARKDTPDGNIARPGGIVDTKELEHRQATHARWSIDLFQVESAEGKKRFHDFDLPLEIMHAVSDLGFKYCTPIQALSLDHALAGQNVAGKAQTGTGKTAAFLIAMLTRYLRNPENRPSKSAQPRALVIAPTRELVIQICKDADNLGKYCNLRYLAIYGGMDHGKQREELQSGPIDLLVATPGRLLDYVKSRTVDLSGVDTLVIDEADRMLDMGFIPDVRRIIGRLPAKEKRCTMLYSATLSDDVMRLASQWMPAPVRVEVDTETMTVGTIKQIVYAVAARDKINLLLNLLNREKETRTLIFCNRRETTERVANELTNFGMYCDVLSGDVNQSRRLRVLEDFRSGKTKVVVATDVAGRGLHIDDINYVINYDFPYEPEDYVHRIGRTGRAGQSGTAISFADENESFIIPDIEKFIGEVLSCSMPEDALLAVPKKTAAANGKLVPATPNIGAKLPAKTEANVEKSGPKARHSRHKPHHGNGNPGRHGNHARPGTAIKQTATPPQPPNGNNDMAMANITASAPRNGDSHNNSKPENSTVNDGKGQPQTIAAKKHVHMPVILSKKPIIEEWVPGSRS